MKTAIQSLFTVPRSLRPRRWYFCCRAGHPLALRDSVSAAELMSYPLAVTIRPPNLRKVIVDLSGRPDYLPNVECENGHSLLGVVLNSDAIGICSANSDALHGAASQLVRLTIDGLRFVFRAITPPGRPRRFDARFFLADAAQVAGDAEDFSAACDELSHLHWISLTEVRSLDLPFITEVVLAEVAALLSGQPDHGVPFFDNSGPVPTFRRLR